MILFARNDLKDQNASSIAPIFLSGEKSFELTQITLLDSDKFFVLIHGIAGVAKNYEPFYVSSVVPAAVFSLCFNKYKTIIIIVAWMLPFLQKRTGSNMIFCTILQPDQPAFYLFALAQQGFQRKNCQPLYLS